MSVLPCILELSNLGRWRLALIWNHTITANLGLLTILIIVVDVSVVLQIIKWKELLNSGRSILEVLVIICKQ